MTQSSVNIRQFKKDLEALQNGEKYTDGKNEHGQEVRTMTKAELVEKYPSVFPDDTDPERLPTDSNSIAAYLAISAAGAKKAITREKINNRDVKQYLEEEGTQELLNPELFSSVSKGEDGEEDLKLYLQSPDSINKLTKHIFQVVLRMIEKRSEAGEARIREDLEVDFNNKIETATLMLRENLIKDLDSKVEKSVKSDSEETTVRNVFQRYGNQIIHINDKQNALVDYLNQLLLNGGTREDTKKVYDEWEEKTVAKAELWRERNPGGALTPTVVKSFTDASLFELGGEKGFAISMALPAIDMNFKVPAPQVNQPTEPITQGQQPNQPNNIITGTAPQQQPQQLPAQQQPTQPQLPQATEGLPRSVETLPAGTAPQGNNAFASQLDQALAQAGV